MSTAPSTCVHGNMFGYCPMCDLIAKQQGAGVTNAPPQSWQYDARTAAINRLAEALERIANALAALPTPSTEQ